MKRRSFLKATAIGGATLYSRRWALGQAVQAAGAAVSPPLNLAPVAIVRASFVSGDQTLAALNSGFDPRTSRDVRHGSYGNWPQSGTQWVEYEWSRPISTNAIDVYWFTDGRGIKLPKAARLLYWDGSSFVAVGGYILGVAGNQYNRLDFAEITTPMLRLEMDSPAGERDNSTGILQWKVYDSGKSPDFPPILKAGPSRVVVANGRTFLTPSIRDLRGHAAQTVGWTKTAGPGEVNFADAGAAVTTATFSAVGEYVLTLTAGRGDLSASDTVRVRVDPPAPAGHLQPVATKNYQINSPLWNARLKSVIVNWIPHCYAQLSDLNLKEGGINNFIQAGKKLSGQPAGRHIGYPWANAYLHNTVESMCLALMLDPQGDAEIIAAQEAMRAKLNEWIPIVLSAQEPDGYMQTRFTLDPRNPPHWDARTRGEHEGYTGGYFIESAVAHYQMSGGKDTRLYDAAKRLADCWFDHLGPAPKKAWFDGHEEIEQALVRLARLVNEVEGAGKGAKYIELARFLLDCRGHGTPYDQSQAPVIQQYEAVGHAVRAAYLYSAMTDIALETGDVDYQSAVKSIWDNLVNKKYYVTGGIGSGETSEGFGPDFSLRNSGYCESCSSCGEVFFQYKMGRAFQDAKYADLYETSLYNAILGSLDLEGKNFYYDNPLEGGRLRYPWHTCPCCVGNIPRTLLQLPTWMYARSEDGVYVNLYLGSTVNVGAVGGTDVQMVQTTDYPWDGKVSIVVNPAASRAFTVWLRSPSFNGSTLYTDSGVGAGISAISVNGSSIGDMISDRGYIAIRRTWTTGDRIEFECSMRPQSVRADEHIAADQGRLALRCGPLIYTIETADQANIDLPVKADCVWSGQWKPDILGGVRVLNGVFANGSALVAIPNYARVNRGGRFAVWMKQA